MHYRLRSNSTTYWYKEQFFNFTWTHRYTISLMRKYDLSANITIKESLGLWPWSSKDQCLWALIRRACITIALYYVLLLRVLINFSQKFTSLISRKPKLSLCVLVHSLPRPVICFACLAETNIGPELTADLIILKVIWWSQFIWNQNFWTNWVLIVIHTPY